MQAINNALTAEAALRRVFALLLEAAAIRRELQGQPEQAAAGNEPERVAELEQAA